MFIARRPDGTIYGSWSVMQWAGQEEVHEQNSELLTFLNPPNSKEQQIAALLHAKGVTREDVWNCMLAANGLAQAQATATGTPLATVLASYYTKNSFYRQCKDLEAAIRAVELGP